jgi:hypothetical protein
VVIEIDRTENALKYVPEDAVFSIGCGSKKTWYVHPVPVDGQKEKYVEGCSFKTRRDALAFAGRHKRAVLDNPVIRRIL